MLVFNGSTMEFNIVESIVEIWIDMPTADNRCLQITQPGTATNSAHLFCLRHNGKLNIHDYMLPIYRGVYGVITLIPCKNTPRFPWLLGSEGKMEPVAGRRRKTQVSLLVAVPGRVTCKHRLSAVGHPAHLDAESSHGGILEILDHHQHFFT